MKFISKIVVFLSISVLFLTLLPSISAKSASPLLHFPVAALHPIASPFQTTVVTPHLDKIVLPTERVTPDEFLKNYASSTTPPKSLDLSMYAPPIGVQETSWSGPMSSCTGWAVTYNLLGWFAKKYNYYPYGGFAPMYTYSQATGGNNIPIQGITQINILHQQGTDTRAHYWQGDYNFWNLPTADEKANAANYKTASPLIIATDYKLPIANKNIRLAIETAMAGDSNPNTYRAPRPIVIEVQVDDSFVLMRSNNAYKDALIPGLKTGGHAMMATSYDENGLWVVNQWGTIWGKNGWAELSWNYIQNNLYAAYTIAPNPPKLPTPHANGRTRGIVPL